MRSDWERMRMLATIVIQPHVKKKLTPAALLPFEWDKPQGKGCGKRAEQKKVTKEEDRRRLDELMKRKKG
jgi:hypothetical protein